VRVIFPFLLVIFSVGQNVFDINYLSFIIDRNDESISIASDVEYGEVLNGFGCGKEALNVDQVLPGSLASEFVPVIEGSLSICVVSTKLAKAFVADDVHGCRSIEAPVSL
jgi:hypothetical protein